MMPVPFDSNARGATLATAEWTFDANIGISDWRIAAIEASLPGDASTVIDARGLAVLTISHGEVIMQDGRVLGKPGRGLLLSRGRYHDLEER